MFIKVYLYFLPIPSGVNAFLRMYKKVFPSHRSNYCFDSEPIKIILSTVEQLYVRA